MQGKGNHDVFSLLYVTENFLHFRLTTVHVIWAFPLLVNHIQSNHCRQKHVGVEKHCHLGTH